MIYLVNLFQLFKSIHLLMSRMPIVTHGFEHGFEHDFEYGFEHELKLEHQPYFHEASH